MIILKNNSALGRIIVALFSQGITISITLISLPFLIALFGLKDYAIFGLFLTFQSLSSIIEGGASVNVINEVAQNQNETSLSNSIFLYKKIFFISLIIFFLTSTIVFYNWDYSFLKIIELGLIIATSISLRLLTNFYKSISLGYNNHNYVNLFSILFYFIRFVTPLMFSLNITFYLYFQLIVIIIELMYFKRLSPIRINFKYILIQSSEIVKNEKYKSENELSNNIFILTILSVFITNIDKTLLTLIGSQEDFGGFQAITNLSGGLLILLGPLNAVFQPLLISQKKDQENYFKLFSTYWLLLVIGFGIVTMILQLCSNQILKFWLGVAYSNSLVELFNYHLVFSFGIGVMSFGYMYSVINKHFVQYIRSLLIFTCITFLIYSILFTLKHFVQAIFFGSIISLIFSSIILVSFGNNVLVGEIRFKSFKILFVTLIAILFMSISVLFKFDYYVLIFISFVYFLFLVNNKSLFNFLLSTLKNCF